MEKKPYVLSDRTRSNLAQAAKGKNKFKRKSNFWYEYRDQVIDSEGMKYPRPYLRRDRVLLLVVSIILTWVCNF